MSNLRLRSKQRGFNLIEVMAAVLVVCFGLLGLAKIEGMAVAETTTSKLRSIAALEASSLAAAMHGNPGYWQSNAAPASCNISGATICSSALTVTSACSSVAAPCGTAAVAALDVQNWATAANSVLPGFTGSIACTVGATDPAASSGGSAPAYGYSCQVTLNWTEKTVAIDQGVAGQGGGTTMTQTYQTTVWP